MSSVRISYLLGISVSVMQMLAVFLFRNWIGYALIPLIILAGSIAIDFVEKREAKKSISDNIVLYSISRERIEDIWDGTNEREMTDQCQHPIFSTTFKWTLFEYSPL